MLAIQRKFLAAVQNLSAEDARVMVYHGELGDDLSWDALPELLPGDGQELLTYSKQPFSSYEEYVSALKGIAQTFPESMKQSNKKGGDKKGKDKGRTMLQILQAGSAYQHYMYLQNNNIFRNIAEGEDIKTGTTHNEAEARILKNWGECVRKQHA